jgi:AcrR family transcriptional regulator
MNMRSSSLYKRRQRETAETLFVQAAESAIAAKGYEGATMQDIARAAGCGVGTLYLHFENKEELFNALVARHCQAIADELDRASAGCRDPREQLQRRTEAMIDYFNAHREFFRVFYDAGITGRAYLASNLRGRAMQAYLDAKARETEMLRAAQQAGHVRRDISAADLVEFLHGVMMTTQARWSAEGNAPEPAEQKRLIWGLLGAGMGVREA